MDVDGVLTDGGMYYSEEGEKLKKFNTRDGMGITLLRKNGVTPIIISKEKSKIILGRAKKLKINEVCIGAVNKVKVLEKIITRYNSSWEQVAYIGDDINDLQVLRKVGLSFAPLDAMEKIKQHVNCVVNKKGGRGAVREAIEIILARDN